MKVDKSICKYNSSARKDNRDQYTAPQSKKSGNPIKGPTHGKRPTVGSYGKR